MAPLPHYDVQNDAALVVTAIRAQGAGGQRVNKASTAVHLRFDIRASALPQAVQQRLLAARHHLLTEDGVIVIKSQTFRQYQMNRDAALARLNTLLMQLTATRKKRRQTRPGTAVKQRRRQNKMRHSARKALRSRPC